MASDIAEVAIALEVVVVAVQDVDTANSIRSSNYTSNSGISQQKVLLSFLKFLPQVDLEACVYLVEAHAEQKQQHVDDLVAHQLPGKADHDEHSSTHVDPILSVKTHHHPSQQL